MSLSAWKAVVFEPEDDIQVNKTGQLQANIQGIQEWQRTIGSKTWTVEGMAADVDGYPFGGLSFDLHSAGKAFFQLHVGLTTPKIEDDNVFRALPPVVPQGLIPTQFDYYRAALQQQREMLQRQRERDRKRHDKSDDIDFSVRIERSKFCGYDLYFQEYGKVLKKVACDGDEKITIRLNRTGDRVEYLVNGNVQCVSEHSPRHPLVGKVLNVQGANVGSIYPPPNGQGLFVGLPVNNLLYCKNVFKVIVLRVINHSDDSVITACSGLSGDECTTVESQPGTSIASIQDFVAQSINEPSETLQLLSECGKLLALQDTWPLKSSSL